MTERTQIEMDGTKREQVDYRGQRYDVLASWQIKRNQVIVQEDGKVMVLRKT